MKNNIFLIIEKNRLVFSFLILALYAGEASLHIFGLPVSLPSSVFYALLGFGILIGIRNITVVKEINIVFVFYLLLLVRSISFDNEIVLTYWLPNFMTLTLFLFIYGFCIRDKQYVVFFLNFTFVFLSIIMCIALIKIMRNGFTSRLSVFGGPNGFYKMALFYQCFAYVYLLKTKKLRYVVAIIISVLFSIMTGSKGAIITIICLAFLEYWYYLNYKKNTKQDIIKKTFRLLLISILVILVVYFVVKLVPQFNHLYMRAIAIFSGNANQLTSVEARNSLYILSWNVFTHSPLFGSGPLCINRLTNGIFPYAHNVFLELLAEQGIIVFGIFVIALVQFSKGFKKKYLEDDNFYLIYMGFVIYFIGAQFSGNILDSKVFLCYLMIGLGYLQHYFKDRG